MTTHAIQLPDSFEAAHPLIILLQLSGMTSYFDVYSLSIAEYDNEDIPKIHLTAEEPPWDPSTHKYSERETQRLDHQGQIIILATVARGPVYVSTVILYSLAYGAADVTYNDILANELSAQKTINRAYSLS